MGVKIQTIKDIRFYLARELKNVYNEPEIRVLADILIKTVTGIKKLHQLFDNGYPISSREVEMISKYAELLKTGMPIQYIIGETTFYNCIIKVNKSTLIPRPETEELVDLIIKENKSCNGHIIDFGTGSGCIAIALAKNLPSCNLTGIEIAEDAIKIAEENVLLNSVKVTFMRADIFDLNQKALPRASIIVSNPPYVRNSEKLLMAKNVLDFEPHQALFVTDYDPLAYYKAILKISDNVLIPGGRLYFEINEAMGDPLIGLFESTGFSEIEIIQDINNKDRIIKGRKNG